MLQPRWRTYNKLITVNALHTPNKWTLRKSRNFPTPKQPLRNSTPEPTTKFPHQYQSVPTTNTSYADATKNLKTSLINILSESIQKISTSNDIKVTITMAMTAMLYIIQNAWPSTNFILELSRSWPETFRTPPTYYSPQNRHNSIKRNSSHPKNQIQPAELYYLQKELTASPQVAQTVAEQPSSFAATYRIGSKSCRT